MSAPNFSAQKAAFNAQFGPLVSPAKPNRPNRATRKNSNFTKNFSGPGSLNPDYTGSYPNLATWAKRNRSNNMTSYSAHTNIAAKAAKCQARMKDCMAARGGSRTRQRRKTRSQRR